MQGHDTGTRPIMEKLLMLAANWWGLRQGSPMTICLRRPGSNSTGPFAIERERLKNLTERDTEMTAALAQYFRNSQAR